MSSRIRFIEGDEPPTPPAGYIFLYVDSTDGRIKTKDSSGVVRVLDSVTAADLVDFVDDAAYVTAFGGPSEGNVYWNTTLKAIRTYNGSSWTTLGGGWVAEVADFASLPAASGSGSVYLVLASTGFDWNTQRGLYRDDGTWNRLSNATLKSNTLEFDTSVANPAYSEGLTFYDNAKNAVSYYNDQPDVTVNTGQEVLIPVYNDTGATIDNGQVVYPSGVHGGSGLVTIALADASVKDKCRLIGMATHSIEHNTTGYVTRIGSVGNVNTLGLSGILYLSATIPGAYTLVKPDDGGYITAIGAVGVSDATDGTIVVDPTISELTVEVTDTNGFPPDMRSGTTLTFVNGTRTLTIAPTGSGFHYYQDGDKFEKASSESIVITDVEGTHLIYYDGETLTAVANPNEGIVSVVIRTKCLVSYLYWNATDNEYLFMLDERHGISMSNNTHVYLHYTRGCQYLQGLALNNILSDNSGNADVDAQFGVDSGLYTDEDITTASSAVTSTVGLPIYYLDGATGVLRKTTETGFSVLTDTTAGVGVTGRLVYNEFTGATWQLTTITNNAYVLCHVFAITGVTGNDQAIAVVGQADYGNLSSARAGAETEISNLLVLFPSPEIIPVATIIYQTSDSYSNAVMARVRTTETGEDYVDWRTSELTAGAAPSSHNNLANLELAGTGVTYGHVDDQTQTIYGLKIFNGTLTIDSGVLVLKETTEPVTVPGSGQFYATANIAYFKAGDGTVTNLLAAGAGGYWDRTGTTLSPLTAGDDIDTSGDVYIKNIGAGYTVIDKDVGGVFLTSGTMDTTNQYTAGIKFGSTDANFTTNNPKFLAGIFGRSTEVFAGDTDSGMAIDFFTTLTNQGATTTPDRRMTIDSDAIIINPDYKDQDWRMFKSGSGTSWAYNAGTDTHAIDGTLNLSGTSNISNLNVSTNLNCNGHFDFNVNYLDKNFYMRKLTSGFAFVFDAGNDAITLGSNTTATELFFMSGLPSGATAAGAGAGADELWTTLSHATLPDNVVMKG